MAAKKPAKTEKAAPVTGAQEEKLKALEHALADLDKQFGKGAVMKLGDNASMQVDAISTARYRRIGLGRHLWPPSIPSVFV